MNLKSRARTVSKIMAEAISSVDPSGLSDDVLTTLKEEHNEVKGLLSELSEATGAAKRKDLVKRIRKALVPHTQAEQKVVYDAVLGLRDKEANARELGAHHYIDSTAGDVAAALQALGGASVVLATAANSAAMAQTVGGLGPEGELVIVGVTAEPLPIAPIQLITPGLSVAGHPSGTSRDVEETMHFAVLSGVRAWIEERPLAEAAEAYAAMAEGRARYRMVLTM